MVESLPRARPRGNTGARLDAFAITGWHERFRPAPGKADASRPSARVLLENEPRRCNRRIEMRGEGFEPSNSCEAGP